jgi:drug/metabolite transporter (DMT)-like permease
MEAKQGSWATGVLCGLAAALIWGGFPVMTRLGVAYSSLDHYDITFLRFVVAGTLLAPVLFRSGLRGLGPIPILLMVLGIGAPYILIVSGGLARAPVSQFAVLTPGSMIAVSVVLSSMYLGNHLPVRERIGLALIAVGICLVGYQAIAGAAVSKVATGLFLLGGVLWALYTVIAKAYSVGALHATAVVAVFSALLYTPIYIVMKWGNVFHAPVRELAGQAFYQGVMVSIGALYFYNKSVAILGPTIGASFVALVPVFAFIEASLLLGEAPTLLSLAALVVVTGGMLVNVTSKARS